MSLVTLSKIKRCRGEFIPLQLREHNRLSRCHSPDISVSSMDYILNQTASEDGEIKDGEIEEIPMEEYDTVSDLYVFYLHIERSVL